MIRRNSNNLLIGLTLVLVVFAVWSIGAQSVPTGDMSESPTPSELHRWLAQGKAGATVDAAVKQSLLKQTTVECTQTNYDVLFYDLWLDIDDTTEYLYGHLRTVSKIAENNTSELQYDLLSNMIVDSVKSPASTLTFNRDGDVLIVTLDESHSIGDTVETTVFYQGHPDGEHPISPGFFFESNYYTDPVIYSHSQPYGARSWWPCKDRRDDLCDSMAITVRASDDFYVVSNGNLDSVVTIFGMVHVLNWYYFLPYPAETDLISLAVADYEIWYDQWYYNDGADSMPIVQAVYPQAVDESLDMLDITPDIMTELSSLYGTYPYVNCKYGHATTEYWGATEHITMTSTSIMPEYSSYWGFEEYVVAHEMSHSWFGDMISCKSWADIWLNEAWATYSEALYFQYKYAHHQWQRYHEYMNGLEYTDGGTIYRTDTTTKADVFDIIVYDKGAWMLHMLRRAIGDSVFFDAVDAYTHSQYRFHSLSTAEYIDFWEQTTGLELNWFFDQWLYGEYRPRYLWAFLNEPTDSGTYNIYLALDQMQTTEPQVFIMPVDVVLQLESGPTDTLRLWVDRRKNVFAFEFESPMVDIDIDPGDWLMNYETEINWRLHFIVPNRLPDSPVNAAYSIEMECRGGSEDNTFSFVEGTLPPGMTFDTETALLSGRPTDTGKYLFTLMVDDNGSNYWDEQEFELHIVPRQIVPGDINGDESQDIADVVFLVTYMFQLGPPPPYPEQADVNNDCSIDIADLVYLVTYMFSGGPPPLIGCAVL
ncbi:MAG TPA: M1 family aminopeptidase [candidate division Zixibacteria bacterium]|nr:M1 family aminopeptidase [candidate division Zixibacteria bacterium]